MKKYVLSVLSVSAAFVIQHAMRMRRIIWSYDLLDYHILTH
jgi:hypothetical protein